MRFNRTILILASLSILAACQPAVPTTATPNATAPVTAPITAVAAPAPETSTPAAPMAVAATGIAVCDDYLNKYEACLRDKLPQASRVQFQSSLDAMRTSWMQMAANPQTAAALESACVQAKSSAAVSMKAYGCSFE